MPGPAGRRPQPAAVAGVPVSAPTTSVRRPEVPNAAARLGNDAKSAATAGQDHRAKADESLREKYRARRDLSPITTLRRVSRCGRVSTNEGGTVALRYTPGGGEDAGTAGLGGLVTCGSLWACPVCSAKISARRAQELEHLITWNAERGGTVALLTLTMRHHAGHRLRDLRRGLSAAWRHVTGSRGWKDAKKRLDMDYVRGIEATHGRSGWHLHIHTLLVFPQDVAAEIPALTVEVWTRWVAGLAKRGFDATLQHGVDVRVGTGALEQLGRYISKLAFETAGARWKHGKNGSRTPFQILADALDSGGERDLALWAEWEQASHGMRQLVWSNGLKTKCSLDDVDDETIAEETDDGELVAVLPARTWRQVYPAAEELLIATRHGGVAGGRAWLDARGLPYDFEYDDTERAVMLDEPERPFAWLKAALATEDVEQRRERRRRFDPRAQAN